MSWRQFREYKPKLTPRAYSLRREATPGENNLWDALRQLRHSHQLKFRRQQPIGPYIADFYCPFLKCVVEVDGQSHDNRIEKDKARDAFMTSRGIRMLRFLEQDACGDCEAIIETILHAVGTPPQTPPSRGGA